MGKLESLAERLEAATGPDRELDEAILKGCWHTGRRPTDLGPRFTASLDDAMKLVPGGWYWRVGHSTLYAGWAGLNAKHPDFCDRNEETFAKAATPALALCAAALRSLALMGEKE